MKWATLGLAAVAAALVTAVVVGRATGRYVPYALYTHCGIRYADLDGKRFFADPPLNDGQGNPPSGWGNPMDDGVLFLQDPDTAVFIDWTGHRANFSTHPKSGIPVIELCS